MNLKSVSYIGCDDATLDLFEGQYALPDGMCYNSYLLCADKVAVLDTIDKRCTDEWLNKLEKSLMGRTPDYLVVHHMEPDHSGSLARFLQRYPEVQIVCSKIAENMMKQFGVSHPNVLVVKEGDVLDLGGLTLRFIAAPMIHWPEVLMSYCVEERVLFSADAFGKFGVYDADKDDWACEARRYYFNIVGKYGVQVQAVLKKIAALPIDSIAPLHGYVLEGEQLTEALRLYTIWSAYGVETEGVFVVSASIHGNTLQAAEYIADELRQKGVKVAFTDLTRNDMAEAVEDAFRYGKMILCACTYDADLFPPMHTFLHKLQLKGYKNRRVALVENGSWAPAAAKVMRGMIEQMQNVEVVEPVVTLRGCMKEADKPALATMISAME